MPAEAHIPVSESNAIKGILSKYGAGSLYNPLRKIPHISEVLSGPFGRTMLACVGTRLLEKNEPACKTTDDAVEAFSTLVKIHLDFKSELQRALYDRSNPNAGGLVDICVGAASVAMEKNGVHYDHCVDPVAGLSAKNKYLDCDLITYWFIQEAHEFLGKQGYALKAGIVYSSAYEPPASAKVHGNRGLPNHVQPLALKKGEKPIWVEPNEITLAILPNGAIGMAEQMVKMTAGNVRKLEKDVQTLKEQLKFYGSFNNAASELMSFDGRRGARMDGASLRDMKKAVEGKLGEAEDRLRHEKELLRLDESNLKTVKELSLFSHTKPSGIEIKTIDVMQTKTGQEEVYFLKAELHKLIDEQEQLERK